MILKLRSHAQMQMKGHERVMKESYNKPWAMIQRSRKMACSSRKRRPQGCEPAWLSAASYATLHFTSHSSAPLRSTSLSMPIKEIITEYFMQQQDIHHPSRRMKFP